MDLYPDGAVTAGEPNRRSRAPVPLHRIRSHHSDWGREWSEGGLAFLIGFDRRGPPTTTTYSPRVRWGEESEARSCARRSLRQDDNLGERAKRFDDRQAPRSSFGAVAVAAANAASISRP